MRDDTARWDPPGPLSYTSEVLTIAEVVVSAQYWVSGTDVLARFRDQLICWPDIATGGSYALSLRRDRVLLVGETDLTPGFTANTGLAVTDVSDAYQVIDLSGPQALERLRHGVELSLAQPSASVTRRAFGAEVMIYRFGDADRYRIHAARGVMQSVFRQLMI